MYRVIKIKNLADKFYKLAGVKSITKKAAELDANASSLLYFLKKEISSLRKDPEAEELVRELQLLKAKYQEAVLINGGYQIIANHMKDIMNEYSDLIFNEDEEEEESPLENLLNQLTSDIKRRSKDVPPSPQKEKLVRDAGREAEFKLDEGESERSIEPSMFGGEEEQGTDRVSNPSEDSIGTGANVFARLVSGGGEKGAPTGFQVGGRDYTNWETKYADLGKETVKEYREIGTPEAENIGKPLAILYAQLGAKASEWLANYQQYLSVVEPTARKTIEEAQKNIEESMNELREKIRGQKQKFNNIKRARYIQDLKNDLVKIKDPTERFIKEQQVAIAETTNSDLHNIGNIQKVRRDMIRKLKGKVYKDIRTGQESVYGKIALTPEAIDEYNKKVEDAKTKLVSHEEYKKQQTEKRRQEQKAITPEEAAQKGEKRLSKYERTDYDWGSMELPSLIKQLSEKLANTKMGEQKVITEQFKKNPLVMQTLTPLIKKLQEALIKGSREEYTVALKSLNDQIRNNTETFGRSLPAFIRYEAHLRTSRGFNEVLTMAKDLSDKLFIKDNKTKDFVKQTEVLSPENINLAQSIIDKATPLIEYHSRTKHEGEKDIERKKIPPSGSVSEKLTGGKSFHLHMGSPAEVLGKITAYLQNMIDAQNIAKAGKISLRMKLIKKLSQLEDTIDNNQPENIEEEQVELEEPEEPITPTENTIDVPTEGIPDWVIEMSDNVLDTLIDKNIETLLLGVSE